MVHITGFQLVREREATLEEHGAQPGDLVGVAHPTVQQPRPGQRGTPVHQLRLGRGLRNRRYQNTHQRLVDFFEFEDELLARVST